MAESVSKICVLEVQGHPKEPQLYPLFADIGTGMSRTEEGASWSSVLL